MADQTPSARTSPVAKSVSDEKRKELSSLKKLTPQTPESSLSKQANESPTASSSSASIARGTRSGLNQLIDEGSSVMEKGRPKDDANAPARSPVVKMDESQAHEARNMAIQPGGRPQTSLGEPIDAFSQHVESVSNMMNVKHALQRVREACGLPEINVESVPSVIENEVEWMVADTIELLQTRMNGSGNSFHGVEAALSAWEKAERKLRLIEARAEDTSNTHRAQIRSINSELLAKQREIERYIRELNHKESERARAVQECIRSNQLIAQLKAELDSFRSSQKERNEMEVLKARLVVESIKNEAQARERHYVDRVSIHKRVDQQLTFVNRYQN
jgi:hypothetical protein